MCCLAIEMFTVGRPWKVRQPMPLAIPRSLAGKMIFDVFQQVSSGELDYVLLRFEWLVERDSERKERERSAGPDDPVLVVIDLAGATRQERLATVGRVVWLGTPRPGVLRQTARVPQGSMITAQMSAATAATLRITVSAVDVGTVRKHCWAGLWHPAAA
jgi:hypothetical protein